MFSIVRVELPPWGYTLSFFLLQTDTQLLFVSPQVFLIFFSTRIEVKPSFKSGW